MFSLQLRSHSPREHRKPFLSSTTGTVALQRDLEVSWSLKEQERLSQSPRKDLTQQPKETKKEKLSWTLCSRIGGTVQGTVLTGRD